MKHARVPNVCVWSLARDYVESAEHLLDVNRLPAAVVLAGLAGEILLKSFLIEKDLGGSVRTKRGHEFLDLSGKMTEADRQEFSRCSNEIDPTVNLFKGLAQFGGVFVEARYRYEPDAMPVISSEAIYFARHLCDTVYLLGKSAAFEIFKSNCTPSQARPNPSFEARPNGKPQGPGHRYGVHFLWPGPCGLPSVPPQLKR